MLSVDIIKTFIESHIDMTRRVWDSINQITEAQFLVDDTYSRGSIRNLMAHLASTDRRWLAGLKNLPEVGHLDLEEYQMRTQAREAFENVAKDLADYISMLTNDDLNQHTDKVAEPRWQILLHLVNHGTDHRATVLQKLNAFGTETFAQDFILWLWDKK
jgi:uncharacterized damage-inducible protein DinB